MNKRISVFRVAFVEALIIIVFIIAISGLPRFVKKNIDNDFNEFEKTFGYLYDRGYRDAMKEVGNTGIAGATMNDNKIEQLKSVFASVYDGEEYDLYYKIIFGGFSYDEYLSTHKLDDLYMLTLEIDEILDDMEAETGYHFCSFWWLIGR